MKRLKCVMCGSTGYSASSHTLCECGGRCKENKESSIALKEDTKKQPGSNG